MIQRLNKQLSNGEVSCVSLATQCIDLLEGNESKRINAFISVEDRSRIEALAKQSDERRQSGKPLSPIDGLAIAVKDNICTSTMRTTCASKMLQNFTSPFDATCVERLKKAGALVVAKTNMDEFGMGSFNTNSHFGPVLNPLNNSVSGGSSGGSAAAMGMSLGLIGTLGTDTGGSVRLPSSYCGTIGFKPSYGRVSRLGLVAYASSLDTIGIIGNDVSDISEIYKIISGQDERDSTCIADSDHKIFNLSHLDFKKLKIGIPKEYYIKELSNEALVAWSNTIEAFKSLGANVVQISLPHTASSLAAYYVIACAEASSNLARYTGIAYGHAANRESNLSFADSVLRSRSEGFGAEVKRRIALGTFCLSRKSYESFYLKSLQVRRRVKNDFEKVFKTRHSEQGVDLILCPTAPSLPPTSDECQQMSIVESFASDVFTVPASLAGLPAISLPVKCQGNKAHSIGVQLISQYKEEELLLNAASQLQYAIL